MPITTSGRRGPQVRSDCWIQYEPREHGGIEVLIRSKVAALYGRAIREQAEEVLRSLEVKSARLEIEDAGALPFVIGARIESAVRRADLTPRPPQAGWLPPLKSGGQTTSARERLRRSRLYLPGNEPKFMLNAGLHKPDGVILDLEDAVAPSEKDAAQVLVRNALRTVGFFGAERMVRINQGDAGLEDLAWIIPNNVHTVLIPKVETPEQVIRVDRRITELLVKDSESHAEVFLMPIIESAKGGINAFAIASAASSVVALAIGLEDYTADIGVERTLEGRESFWLRSQVVNAAKAAGVQAIDTVFSDVSDMEGLRTSARESKALGFEGRGCIHPRQIPVVHQAFAPTAAELAKAQKIAAAFETARKQGLGVVSLGSKMIDAPVVKRALRTVELARAMGMVEKTQTYTG